MDTEEQTDPKGVTRRQVVRKGAKLAYVTPVVAAAISAGSARPAFSISAPKEASTPSGSSPARLPATVAAAPVQPPSPTATPAPSPQPTPTPGPTQAPAPTSSPVQPPARPVSPSLPLPRLPNTGTGGRAHLMDEDSE